MIATACSRNKKTKILKCHTRSSCWEIYMYNPGKIFRIHFFFPVLSIGVVVVYELLCGWLDSWMHKHEHMSSVPIGVPSAPHLIQLYSSRPCPLAVRGAPPREAPHPAPAVRPLLLRRCRSRRRRRPLPPRQLQQPPDHLLPPPCRAHAAPLHVLHHR